MSWSIMDDVYDQMAKEDEEKKNTFEAIMSDMEDIDTSDEYEVWQVLDEYTSRGMPSSWADEVFNMIADREDE